MTRDQGKSARRGLLAAAFVVAALGGARAEDGAPGDSLGYSLAHSLPPAIGVTLLDPTLHLEGLPELDTARLLDSTVSQPVAQGEPVTDLDWRLSYQRSLLDDATTTTALRSDPSTGFSRQLDRDVVDLGLSWHLAGSELGLAYQLQSARPHGGGDGGLARFIPGNPLATNAFTLGVTREWGAGEPAPPLVPAASALAAAGEPAATPTAPPLAAPR